MASTFLLSARIFFFFSRSVCLFPLLRSVWQAGGGALAGGHPLPLPSPPPKTRCRVGGAAEGPGAGPLPATPAPSLHGPLGKLRHGQGESFQPTPSATPGSVPSPAPPLTARSPQHQRPRSLYPPVPAKAAHHERKPPRERRRRPQRQRVRRPKAERQGQREGGSAVSRGRPRSPGRRDTRMPGHQDQRLGWGKAAPDSRAGPSVWGRGREAGPDLSRGLQRATGTPPPLSRESACPASRAWKPGVASESPGGSHLPGRFPEGWLDLRAAGQAAHVNPALRMRTWRPPAVPNLSPLQPAWQKPPPSRPLS